MLEPVYIQQPIHVHHIVRPGTRIILISHPFYPINPLVIYWINDYIFHLIYNSEYCDLGWEDCKDPSIVAVSHTNFEK